jgi:hypothetical protein
MRSSFTFIAIVACTISRGFSKCARNPNERRNTVIKGTVKTLELNSFASIRSCRPWRVISAQTWLAGILILSSFPSAFAESDFSTFWREFKSAVIAGDKAKVAGMTTFPLSMPYLQKTVKNKEDFVRRYNEIFKGEANAAQCFASAEPRKGSARRYEIYCPFKDTPKDWENAPIRFVFELTKTGWKFAGLDNINE